MLFRRPHTLLLFAVLLVPLAARAQPASPDTADVMLGVVETLRAKGQTDDAERLMELIRRLYPNSVAARIASGTRADSHEALDAGSGNTELIVYSTFYGAGLGVIIPAALGAEEPEPYGAGILLGAPAGYGLSKLYTNRYPVSTGQARAMTFGAWWGSLQGLGWREVLDIGDKTETICFDPERAQCFVSTHESDRAPFTAMLVGGLSGLAAGTILGRTLSIEGSTALITNFSAIWGSWFGTVLGVQLGQDDSNDYLSNDNDDDLLTTILVAGNVGLLAGAVGGPSLGWSTREAWAVHLSGIAGLIGGFGIDLLASVESTETGLLIPGLTSAAALGVAAALVGGNDATSSENHGPRSSIVDFAGGKWSVGVPTPFPTAIPVYKGGRRQYEPGAQVSLLRMAW